MADVFISYASADVAQAHRLSDLLSSAGYSVWWDKHLVSGQQYQESIKHELAHAGVVLVVWTPSSVTSPWVYSEARRGADRQVLVQVRARELTINDLPAPFDAFHCPYVDDVESVRVAIAGLITQPAAGGAVEAPHAPPPARAVATPLPRFNTTLIGREAELEDLIALFDEGARLVTLTGAGGSGKTRLAVALAERLTKSRHGVAAFVSAESVERTEEFWAAIGAAVGAPTEGRLPPGLFEHLKTSSALLVLDNLEQIPTAGDVVADLLDVAPEISIVATSRLPLHVDGEHDYAVEPLAVPSDDSLAAALASPSVALFASQARSVNRTFALTEENAGDVAEICRRLDGLPLAVELIAARVKLMSPRALLPQLDKALDLKGIGGRRPSRHDSLRATIQWSYNLLQPHTQRALRVLSLFPGGATLPALAYVFEQLELAADPFDELEKLADASLVTTSEIGADEPRFRLLNTVRDFAATELEKHEELTATYTAMLAWAWQIFGPLIPFDQAKLSRMETLARREHENLRALLDRDPQTVTLDPEDRLWLARTALYAAVCVSIRDGFYKEAERWSSRAVDIARQARNAGLEAQSLACLSDVQGITGDPAGALETATAALQIARALDDSTADPIDQPETLLGSILVVARGNALTASGDIAGARADVTEALEGGVLLDPYDRVGAHVLLGILKSIEGLAHEALVQERQAIELAKTHGFKDLLDNAEHNAACSLREVGELEEAERLMREGMRGIFETRRAGYICTLVEDYALVLLDLDRFEDAALLYGATGATREALGNPPAPYALDERAPGQQRARVALGDSWERVKAEGARLSVEEAWNRVTAG